MKKNVYRIFAVSCVSGFYKTIKFISARNKIEALIRFYDNWGGFKIKQIDCC